MFTPLFIGLGFGIAFLLGVRGVWLIPSALAIGVACGYGAYRIIGGISNAAGEAMGQVVQPTGDSTPYAVTYSLEQSLAARGDVAGALLAYEKAIRDHPDDPTPRLQCAELCMRSGDPSGAARLFREARALTAVPPHVELYATQRLVDLYLGPLEQQGRALVELRRLSERFPETREGASARDAIGRLKRASRSP